MTLSSDGRAVPAQGDDLRGAVEAILMVTDVPLTVVALATALECPVNVVRDLISSLKLDYDGTNGSAPRGFELREVGGGWRIFVRHEYDWAVKMFIANENPTKLSQAALETLAVIAYKQPISRGQIASIRAVNVDSVVRTLLSRGLITELYTDSESGAIHYGTTELLLEVLGINSLDEMPLISPYLPDANSDFDDKL
ncbi:SMC-Scp complex subunit ScpB [Rhodoluna limnophila]|uniref:SMC-Scp complex subunit ScpB n=1 Tax=Rhodoluna limnophila TaxID=232537 RepID=UPI0011060495|nr:SMC-Scp complex subunit ScpB [Rhodoluna limnophila]